MQQFEQSLRNISLESQGDRPTVVVPDLESESDGVLRFDFPPLPASTLNWLGALGVNIWAQHELCCALLLLLNPERRCWSVTVPPQKLQTDGVSWQMTDAVAMDHTPKTPLFIGGTYQMAQADDPDQVVSLIPQTDGLHLVHAVGRQPAGAWAFLRVGGELSLRYPGDIIFDDMAARTAEVMRVLGLSS